MILDILQGTPWWVYAIFVYLLIIGCKSLRSSSISLVQLIIAPIIFLIWALYSLNANLPTLGIWFVALLAGSAIGWVIFSYHHIRFDRKTFEVHLPGSATPLILYMFFFAVKYALGVTYGINPEMRSNEFLRMTDIIVSGIFPGIFWGRFFHVVRYYMQQ